MVNHAVILKLIDFINLQYITKRSIIIFTVHMHATHSPHAVTKCLPCTNRTHLDEILF